MTRTITLADISPGSALAAGNGFTDKAPSNAGEHEDPGSFAAILQDAGSVGHKGPISDEPDERRDPQRKSDRVTTAGDVAASAAPPLPPVLVGAVNDGRSSSGGSLTAISPLSGSFSLAEPTRVQIFRHLRWRCLI
jgi:hypothetical protein